MIGVFYDLPLRCQRGAQIAAPFLLTFFLMLLGMLPLHLGDFGSIMPSVGLMGVFFWSVYRPNLMGPAAAFLIGFMGDALSGAPLGLGALIAVLVHASVVSQRQLFLAHGFPVLWWGYAMTASIAGILSWVCFSIAYWVVLPMWPVAFQVFAGIALFVPVAWLFGIVQSAFMSDI